MISDDRPPDFDGDVTRDAAHGEDVRNDAAFDDPLCDDAISGGGDREFPASGVDQHLLDCLVDGELSEEEHRRLLLRLEDEPAGWRSLALAFVEAQTWGRDLRPARLLEPAVQSTSPAPASLQFANRLPVRARSRAWLWPMITACCLGVICGSWLTWKQFQPQRKADVAQEADSGKVDPSASEMAEHATDERGSSDSAAASQLMTPPLTTPSLLASKAKNDGDSLLRVEIDDQGNTIDVPLVDSSDVNPDWLRSTSVSLPADVQKALRESGRDVRTQRRLVPFQLEDGRWGVMPVDDVQLLPARQMQ